MLGREERAAILVGDDRDGIGAEALRFGGDLVLVHADERPQHGQRRDLVDRAQILDRLRRHLADDLAGHERAGAMLVRDGLGNAHHQPAIDDDAQGRRDREDDLLLDLAERHEEEPRAMLELASAGAPARAPSPATPATGSDSCGSGRRARGSRGASGATPRPANRCRPTAGRRLVRSTPTGRPPAPGCLPKK